MRGLSVVHGHTIALREVDLTLGRGRVTALMGRNGAGKSSLIWALQGSGRRSAGRVDVGGADPARARTRRASGSWSGWCRRTPPTCSTSRPCAEECAAADGGTGAARALLDRLVPGIPDDQHPRDLSEGQRLALALALVLVGRPPRAAARRADPRPGLRREAGARRRSCAVWPPRGTRCWSRPTTSSSSPRSADDVVVLADGDVVSSGPVRRVVAESPSFAPQVTKVLGPPWLRVDEVAAQLAALGAS